MCVCALFSVFYGHSLRLINIDSELSLLAGSQVGSTEQIGHTGEKEKHTVSSLYIYLYLYVCIQVVFLSKALMTSCDHRLSP